MMGRRVLALVCAMVVLASGCSSATSITDAPLSATPVPTRPQVEPTAITPEAPSTTPSPVPTATAEVPVVTPGPAPPPTPGPTGVASEVFDHPLAAALLDDAVVSELLGGEWRLTYAQTVETVELEANPCGTTSIEQADISGIDLNYENGEGSSVGFGLRSGPNSLVLYQQQSTAAACEIEAGTASLVADATVAGVDDHEVVVWSEDFGTNVVVTYYASANARQGQTLIGAAQLVVTLEEGEVAARALATAVEQMFDKLQEA